MRGKWIVFEGLDGAGTTTQAELLAAYLEAGLPAGGERVLRTAEPTSGPFGVLCREALQGRLELAPETLALTFTADRSHHLRRPQGVLERLDRGDFVVMDRFLYSTLAYQDGLPREWLLALCSPFPRPDLLVFLDTPVPVCLDRLTARGKPTDLYEKRETLERIEQSYRWVLEEEAPKTRLRILDGTQSVEALAARIREEVAAWLPE